MITEQSHNSLHTLIAEGLNEPQREAVLHATGSLLIIAGAGSGKTRVITTRIAHLIAKNNIPGNQIVALTFTNKAAGEMRERISHLLQGQHRLPFVGTFHSYCLQLLRSYPLIPSMPQFSILDADDQQDIIKRLMKQYALAKHITASQIGYQISKYKNKTAAGTISIAEDLSFTPLIREIYYRYETEKNAARCLDFDDLILKVLEALQNNPGFKHQLQNNIRHILVDEYQDTSDVQHQLLLAMATQNGDVSIDSMCAVGDEDQSIYSWRGATVANMLKFQNDFAPVTTVKIEQNYRSVQPILDAANQVISHNKLRNPKNLWSTRTAKNRILHAMCTSGDQEGDVVATMVQLVAEKKSLSEIAILYRTHYQSRSIEEAFIHKAIPYKIVGGIRFYERKEIKDLLAYLRLIVNPYDKISLLRVVNIPGRGLGEKFEEELLNLWLAQPLMDFRQVLTFMMDDAEHGLTPTKRRAVTSFLEIYTKLDAGHAPSMLLNNIINDVGYISYLTATFDAKDAQAKIENVQEFVQAVGMFEQKYARQETVTAPPLESFLHEVSLLQESGKNDGEHNTVLMMTLHAAKGLEFDTVIMTGLEEGLLPSQRSLNTHEELEEERRLMYVGMTRAKEHLVICSAQTRYTFGQLIDQAPSRFLDEIPKKLYFELDLENIGRYQIRSHLECWLTGQPEPTPQRDTGVYIPRRDPFQPTAPTATPRPTTTAYQKRAASSTGPGPVTVKRPAWAATRPVSTPATSSAPRTGPASPWLKGQSVQHQKFGLGVVTEVEMAPDSDFYVTVMFKSERKKILGKFLERAHR